MIRSILIEPNKFPFKGAQDLDSPSLLIHQTSIVTDKVQLSKIEAMKAEQIGNIKMLGEQVPENRKRYL